MGATLRTNHVERVLEAMRTENLEAMLFTSSDTVQWMTGFTGSSGQVLLARDKGEFITDSRYTIQAHEQVKDLPTVTQTPGTAQADFLSERVRSFGVQRLGFEASAVNFAAYQEWSEKFSGIELVPVKNLIGPLRSIKMPEEVEAIRRACKLADKCIEYIQRHIQVGISEYELGLEVEFFYRRNGAEVGFEPIVASGERSARPHGRPSDKKIERGDFVTIDCGARLDGYCSDITRTFVVGEASERHKAVYDAVLDAEVTAIQAIKPGLSGKEVDQVARDVLERHGLAQFFGHGLGHGLGRLVHDAGSLSPRSDTVLEPGMVLTVEPGVYIEGFGGVRIEDDIVVTPNGCEVLTSYPKDLIVLP